MDSDNQSENKIDKRKTMPHLWKKGQSGNIMGRPKGKTMKEYARQYLERMTDEERDEWLEGVNKDIVWQMAEGKASQGIGQADDLDKLVVNIVEYGNNNDTPQL